jgi:caffeoyl-CoA O-methyltransferase
MLGEIPPAMSERMAYLENRDSRDRLDGTARRDRLRQVPPATGRFLALLASLTPPGRWLEVGTSAGYSALWLALACRAVGRRLVTFEILPEKCLLAEETMATAGVEDVVELVCGDARELLGGYRDISFCFIDCEKEIYGECYELVVPNMASGGLLVADNVISHVETLQPLVDRAEQDGRVDSVVVPIGRGELVCRKV